MHTLKKIFSIQNAVIAGTVLAAALVLISGAFQFVPQKAQAAPGSGITGDLQGYAWSSTIGWISLNCAEGGSTGENICGTGPLESNYKVTAASNYLSGYAWSSNVGWISFNPSDTTANCGPDLPLIDASNMMSGWAWVMSGSTASGADGCIHLASSYPETVPYGVSYTPLTTTSGSFSGFAWGDTNVGWVSFAYATLGVPPNTPNVDIKVNNSSAWVDGPQTFSVIPGYATLNMPLGWSSANVSSCSASSTPALPGWSPTTAIPLTAGLGLSTPFPVATPDVAGTYVYTITCTPTDTTLPIVTDSVTVILVGGSSTPSVDLDIYPGVPYPGSGAVPGPITLAGGTAATLIYDAYFSTPSTCVRSSSPAVGSPWDLSGVYATGSQAVTIPTNPSTTTAMTETYTYTCTPTGGGTPTTASVVVTIPAGVSVGPPKLVLQEQVMGGSPFPGPITLTSAGGLVDLIWSSANVNSTCVSSSSPSDPYWDGTQPSIASPGYTESFPSNTSTSIETYLYTLTCTPLDGSPNISSTVEIDVTPGTGTTGTGTTGGSTTGAHHLPWQEF